MMCVYMAAEAWGLGAAVALSQRLRLRAYVSHRRRQRRFALLGPVLPIRVHHLPGRRGRLEAKLLLMIFFFISFLLLLLLLRRRLLRLLPAKTGKRRARLRREHGSKTTVSEGQSMARSVHKWGSSHRLGTQGAHARGARAPWRACAPSHTCATSPPNALSTASAAPRMGEFANAPRRSAARSPKGLRSGRRAEPGVAAPEPQSEALLEAFAPPGVCQEVGGGGKGGGVEVRDAKMT